MEKLDTLTPYHHPPGSLKPGLERFGLSSPILLVLAGWSLAVALSLGWNLYQHQVNTLILAQLGELREGSSISAPLQPFFSGPSSQWWALVLGHGFLWLLGLGGIVLSGLQIKKQIQVGQRVEAALQESISKYRELVENANVIIMRVNLQGQVTFFN